ncbi:NIF family HAD-type phosphatase [Gallibacterium anatis]|uniref:NIF family HAD-type phosphatase n=1 Tax=Gallibacterium anatis TaxID=750 RepID=UPI000531E576|nr:NIF family HAD-type phosphatase [Gallibacterium anatis]KGQ29355.1 hypothetical protein JP27_01220 [Gallibacterium anatis]
MDLTVYEALKYRVRGIINKLPNSNSKTIEKKSKQTINGDLKIKLPIAYKENIVSELSEQNGAKYSICVFDLDNTLIETDLFEVEREESQRKELDIIKFENKLKNSYYRIFFDEEYLISLRSLYPNIKFVIFTRSTELYANTLISHIYKKFNWDLIVTRENVRKTKPHNEGLELIMKKFHEIDPRKVLVIGDSDVDIKSAYYNNSTSLLTDWFVNTRKTEHWKAINLLPDGVINSSNMLSGILKSGVELLSLESKLNKSEIKSYRFGSVSHFFPMDFNSEYARKPFNIFVGGRYFSSEFLYKKESHLLTRSILANKESHQFPIEWIESLTDFIESKLDNEKYSETIITVIPHRPNREPRLEFMLEQLSNFVKNKIEFRDVIFCKDLLGFYEGVLSQHNDRLNQHQRFENIGKHLYINKPDLVRNRNVIVIDDVVTTGASLMYASIYLKNSGANNVSLFALAQTISK